MGTLHLTDALLLELDVLLAPRGWVRRDQTFRRDAGECRFLFHVAFIRHQADADVTADVAIRHNAIEHILNADRDWLSAREKRNTSTIGVELGNWAGVGQKRWRLTQTGDSVPMARDIVSWCDRLGEPWLKRFASLTEVTRVLAEDGPEARLICPLPDYRVATLAACRRMQQG
jgi:hypothetical protein